MDGIGARIAALKETYLEDARRFAHIFISRAQEREDLHPIVAIEVGATLLAEGLLPDLEEEFGFNDEAAGRLSKKNSFASWASA